MSGVNDDFGDHEEAPRSDRSETAEDATLHGQPIEDAPGIPETAGDPQLEGSDSAAEAELTDPAALGSNGLDPDGLDADRVDTDGLDENGDLDGPGGAAAQHG